MFLETLTIVLPVFLIIGLGYFLKRIGLIDRVFIEQTNRLVYYVCLPLLLFQKIGTADFLVNFNGRLVIGSALGIAAMFLLSLLWVRLCNYPPADRGVFGQGAFRGNLAYMGLAIIFYAYGEEGFTRAGILMGFLVPVLNFFAIIALLAPHPPRESERGILFWARQILLNPLILASFLGVLWSFATLPIPVIINRGLSIATGMTLPLALIAIGGAFSLERLKGDMVKATLSTFAKLVILPAMVWGILLLLGVGGTDLAIGILMAGTPAATATYIMAHQMRGNAELAGSIVMLSTLLCSVTYCVILLILKGYGL